MSKNLEALVAAIRDIRAQKRPEVKAKLQKVNNLLNALRTTRASADRVAGQYPDLASALQGISFSDAENCLLKASTACEAAFTRLSRDSINIGVAGLSGQGKSQILRMLTGLGDSQIPTGGGGACTAVQSIIHNSRDQKAVIHFLTPIGLLEKKVYPSFAEKGTSPFALGIGPRPGTVDQFLNMDLLSLVPESEQDAARNQADENWDKVKDLQKALKSNPELVRLLGSAAQEVPFGDVRGWLVKDRGETKHNVVEYVEMWTPFDAGLPDGLTVLDIPGLGDPTPGIEEDMRNNLKYKTDIVFFLRKAERDGSRELWKTIDHDAFDMIKLIYPNPADGIKPSDWVQLVLNRDMRRDHWNELNTEMLKTTVRRGFSPVVCDCGSKDAVREMVDANITVLVEQTRKIDDLRIRQAEEAFRIALAEANALYNALRNASGDVVAQESGFPFERRLLSFMAQLRDPFKKDVSPTFHEAVLEILSRHFEAAKARFNDIYRQNEDSEEFPAELPVFSKKRLADQFGAAEGPGGPVEIAVRNQREAVLKLLRNQLTECCGELVTRYFDCVVETGFAPNPALSRIGDGAVTGSRERLTNFLAALRQSGTFTSLEEAVDGLFRFQLTFDGAIVPALYSISELDDFNPEYVVPDEDAPNELADIKSYIANNLHDSKSRAEVLYNWLRQKSESILSCVTSGSARSPLSQITEHVANTMRANYDAFVFRFIWGDTTANEWRRFADRNKAVFWKDEFDTAAANSRLARDWSAALEALRAALA